MKFQSAQSVRLFPMVIILSLIFSALGVSPVRAEGILHAAPNTAGTGDCSSWENACTLQTALTGAVSGDEIWVAVGVYKPSPSPTSRNATFQLKNDVAVYGGFFGTETARDQRTFTVHITTLSGDLNDDDNSGYNAENAYHVVTGASNATLDGFTIVGGNANGDGEATYGGGIYNNSSSNLTLANITFRSNSAWWGGGMYNNSSNPTVTNVTFSNNDAEVFGGGMYNKNSNPTLTNITFSGNSSTYNGGGIGNISSSPILTNITFIGNSAGGLAGGGGMTNGNASSPILTNVTFIGNSAPFGSGGGMSNIDNSNPQILNTIFWDNTASLTEPQIYNDTSSPSVSDNVIQGGCPSGSTCSNIISDDPKLGALDNYGGFTQTIPLLPNSSAIDTGNDATCAETDQRGVSRPQGVNCDVGAYESGYTQIYYVKPIANGSGDCLSWENACVLQTALTKAVGGNELWVMTGTYKPSIGMDRSVTFRLKNGVTLYGGFTGTETAREQRDPVNNPTILSGDIDNNDSQTPIITNITTVTGNTTNSYHVVTGANGALLDGFTITAGNADNTNAYPLNCGGGMVNTSSSPTLVNITFSGNSSGNIDLPGVSGNGGGMCNNNSSSPILTNVIFSSNSALHGGGGGMWNHSSSPLLTNVTFHSNLAGSGGGMNNYSSSPMLTNVTFDGNLADAGSGMNNYFSSPTLTNVTFSGNSASYDGGGMNNYSSSPILTNVTFSGNSAEDGGGIYNNTGSNPLIRNTILWGNIASGAPQIYNNSSIPLVSDSVVQGGYAGGTDIITADPKLGALENYGGYTQTIPLLSGSSATDSGNDSVCPATDQRGVTRPQGAHCDIGAYEQKINLAVSVGGALQGYYYLSTGQSTRVSYDEVNNGPVKVASTDTTNIIAAERVNFFVGSTVTSYAEMMGLPDGPLDTTYWFPWYKNDSQVSTQIRIGNVSGSEAQVHISIAGAEVAGSPYTLTTTGNNQSMRLSYAANNGPVKIWSDQNIVATERVNYFVGSAVTSYTEIMGLPNSQLDTTYWFPWYKNVGDGIDTQLRIGNVSGSEAHVHIYIAGAEVAGSPYTLTTTGNNQSMRLSYAANNGPVKIVSDQNIVASERVNYFVDGVVTSYSEMMGQPNSQLDTTYWFPWYKNDSQVDTQIRIGNVSGSEAHVHVYIGTAEMPGSPFTLATMGSTQSMRLSFTANDGPVKIVSDQNIVAAERVNFFVGSKVASYSEMMGLPNIQLDTTYWFPWYKNDSQINTQLRLGMP